MTKHTTRVTHESAELKREQLKQDVVHDAAAEARAHERLLADAGDAPVDDHEKHIAAAEEFGLAKLSLDKAIEETKDSGPFAGFFNGPESRPGELVGVSDAPEMAKLDDQAAARATAAGDYANASSTFPTPGDVIAVQLADSEAASQSARMAARTARWRGDALVSRTHDWVRTTPNPDGWMCRRFDCGAHVTDPADLNHVTCTAAGE